MDIIKQIKSFLDNKSILILGFGKEGKSTYALIKKYVEYLKIGIADENNVATEEKVYYGEDYLQALYDYDVIIKSPGVSLKDVDLSGIKGIITSQTDLLLRFNKKNIIGVTGTKGKSTTSYLIYSILKNAGKDVKLIGNIGIPPLNCLEEINNDTKLVFEMSSHQLQNVENSPHIAILLNIFEEHLDHYNSYEDYQLAKVNIFKYQDEEDFVVYNDNNELVKNYINKFANSNKYTFPIPYEEFGKLIGEHNKLNVMASVLVARILKIDESIIAESIKEFSPLPHRLEYVGEYDKVKYYNDSIATIPEATISAIESLMEVDTLIVGGMNRGIDYYDFIKYLDKCSVKNIILMYETGELIFNKLKRSGVCLVESLEEAVEKAKEVTQKGRICLLSPAAASYGHFKNFEERGTKFCNLAKGIKD